MSDGIQKKRVETPATSSVENQTQEKNLDVPSVTGNSQAPEQKKELSYEEAEWMKLKGPTQSRIKELIRERDIALARKVVDETPRLTLSEQPQGNAPAEEIAKAVELLEQNGMATKEDLKKHEENLLGQIRMEKTHDVLESKYDGSNGLPKYDRLEVEDYARKNGIWNLEAAFRNMYYDEFVDFAAKKQKTRSVVTEKPVVSYSIGRGEPLTRESFIDQLRGPKGRQIYDKLAKNPQMFDELVKTLSEG